MSVSNQETKMSGTATAPVDFICLFDNTGSMGEACTAAKSAYYQINAVYEMLFGSNDGFELSVYGDYDASTPDNERGGYAVLNNKQDAGQIDYWMSRYVRPCGGGGMPEAVKTGLNFLLREKDASRKKLLFIFTDALPHADTNSQCDTEGKKEIAYLEAYQMIVGWSDIAAALKQQNFEVVTFLTAGRSNELRTKYSKLGHVISITENQSHVIAKEMINMFLHLIGQDTTPSEKDMYTAIQPVCHVNLATAVQTTTPETVLKSFDGLLDKEDPMKCVCLMTNPIVGKFWRLICGKFLYLENEKYADRCKLLMDKLGYCKDRLPAKEKAEMKEWLDKSHNETGVIRRILAEVIGLTQISTVLATPLLVLKLPQEMKNKIKLDEVLEISRSGNYTEVAKLIASVKIERVDKLVLPTDEDEAPDFIPLVPALSALNVFKLISNLLYPGVMFSKNVALLCALISLDNAYLKDAADQLLAEHKGSWINWDLDEKQSQKMPLFWSVSILNLFHRRLSDNYFTTIESSFIRYYVSVARVSRNVNSLITFEHPLELKHKRVAATYKRRCAACGSYRCFTLFPGGDVCAHCLNKANYSPEYEVPEDTDQYNTNWVQCSCSVLYTVTCIDKLNVKPKCFYCRQGLPVPTELCSCCQHTFVSDANAAMIALTGLNTAINSTTSVTIASAASPFDTTTIAAKVNQAVTDSTFLCPFCVQDPRAMQQESELKILEFVEMNEDIKQHFPYDYATIVDTGTKLWKRILQLYETASKSGDEVTLTEHGKSAAATEPEPVIPSLALTGPLQYKKMVVYKPEHVFQQVLKQLVQHDGKYNCLLCASDVPVHSVVDACGHCSVKICRGCSTQWYGDVRPGQVVSYANTICPFCKNSPKHKLVRNLPLGQIRNIRPDKSGRRALCAWDNHKIYALCLSCVKVEEAMDRECGPADGQAPLNIANFVCAGCVVVTAAIIKTRDPDHKLPMRECPKCQVMVQKVGGCNHITCQCGTHWCWSCGMESDIDHIYDHLSACKGIFSNEYGEVDYADEYGDGDY